MAPASGRARKAKFSAWSNGKAALIDPAECIGHGACRAACPQGAITLVFGSEARGVEIPHVGPDFQTNVPGLFIAGELGGMGLIRNAIEQGRQAMESIKRLDGLGRRTASTSSSSAADLPAFRPALRPSRASCASSPSSRTASAARSRISRAASSS